MMRVAQIVMPMLPRLGGHKNSVDHEEQIDPHPNHLERAVGRPAPRKRGRADERIEEEPPGGTEPGLKHLLGYRMDRVTYRPRSRTRTPGMDVASAFKRRPKNSWQFVTCVEIHQCS